jgi:pimeloyl-ACP methyl ester carboxylesterase
MPPSEGAAALERSEIFPCGKPIYRHFPGDPVREFYVYVPNGVSKQTSIAILVHGISGNAAEQILRFASEAERRGSVLIAPLFERAKYGKYQQVVDRNSGIRADLALLDIVDWVSRQIGISSRKFNLFGYSGGSQFAHRFVMLHPERVASCVCASAGWYTFPDPNQRYPGGIRTHPLEKGVFDPEAIRAVPIHVLVGERDIATDTSVRSTPGLVSRQGSTRLERAQRWFDAMRSWALHPASTMGLIPKAGHSFGAAAKRRGLPVLAFERFDFG